MNEMLSEAAVAVSQSAALSILVKATVIALVGLGAARLARRARASTRHLILSLTCVGLLALPFAPLVLPRLTFEVPVPNATAARDRMSEEPTPASIAPGPPPSRVDNASEVESVVLSLTASEAIGGVWTAGSVLLLSWLGLAIWRLGRLRRNGLPQPALGSLATGLAADTGVRRTVDVLLHEDVAAPVTCGFAQPAILLPTDALDWPEADLRRALVHELEHVRRGDWAVYLLARAACALYWFHPLAWLTLRQLSLEAERACDDAVVLRSERADYAQQLVDLARRLSSVPRQPTLAMANRSDLSTRVTAILDATQRRGPTGLAPAALTLAAACAIVLGVSTIDAVAVAPVAGVETAPAASQPPAVPPPVASALDRALVEAADDGELDSVSSLISAGANVNARILGDGSPLIVAARSGHLDAVRLLLEQGADPNLIVRGDGSPLIMAAREGHNEIVELLLGHSARIDQVAPGDENALIQASGEGRLAVVRLLVERGADVNVRVWADQGPSSSGRSRGEWRTPLGMARQGGHDAVVQFLVSAGARE